MKFVLNLMIALFLFTYVNAQDVTYKNQLGVDILPILTSSSGTGFIYKRNYEKGSIRTRMLVTSSSNNDGATTTQSDTITGLFEDDFSSLNFNSSVGYTFSKKFDDFSFDYGIDLYGSHSNQQTEDVNKDEDGVLTSTSIQETSTNSYSLQPLIGFSYLPKSRLNLSLEAYINAVTYTSFAREYSSTSVLSTGETNVTGRIEDDNATTYNLSPNFRLFAAYRF